MIGLAMAVSALLISIMNLSSSVEVFIVKEKKGSKDNETANAQPKLLCNSFSIFQDVCA